SGTDVIAAAILMAGKDGADIINLSLGGGPAYSESADAVAAIKVGAKGHFVLSANGNDGSAGLFVASSPGISRGGFGIASFDNAEVPASLIVVDGHDFAPVGFGSAFPGFPLDSDLSDIVVNNLDADVNNVLDDGMNPLVVNATGKPVLIRWGGASSRARCNSAKAAGATACLLYSNTESTANIFGGDEIYSAFIPRAAGLAIIADIKTGKKPSVQVPNRFGPSPIVTAGTVSDFSSRGIDQDLFIKPDLGGVGGQVLSTISTFAVGEQRPAWNTPYAVYSGTSMATPNTAGSLALLLESRRAKRLDTSFNRVRAILQNSARPARIYNSSVIDTVAAQGAGLLNIYDAITSNTNVYPSALALNDTANSANMYQFQVTNLGTKKTKYTVSSFGAAAAFPYASGDDAMLDETTTVLNATYGSVYFQSFASNSWKFSNTTSFTLRGGESTTVLAYFSAPKVNAKLLPVFSGYIRVANDLDESPSHVPYAGVVGSWNDAPIWSRNSPTFTAWIKNLQDAVGVQSSATTSAATGLYAADFGFNPIAAGATLNATDGIFAPILASSTSRNANITISYVGKNASVTAAIKSLGLNPASIPVFWNLFNTDLTKPATFGSLTPSGSFNGVLQRNAPTTAQSVQGPQLFQWTGEGVSTSGTDVVQLPAGQYQMNFIALKHFSYLDHGVFNLNKKSNLVNYDLLQTPVFNLVY
ncbi:hypothetical protein HDU91_000192, partial [Kappamyces sp. JEL0680]